MAIESEEDDPRKMSLFALRRRRDKFRKTLDTYLSRADAAGFLNLVWCVNALHRGRLDLANSVGFEFSERDMAEAREKFTYAPWTLETLVNEYLTTPQQSGPHRLNVRHQHTARVLVATLNELENAEDGVWLKTQNVLHLTGPMAQRQFPWQRGYAFFLQFFRPLYIFDFPEADERFRAKVGLSLERFVFCGFALFAHLASHRFVPASIDLTPVGVTAEERDKVLTSIAAPLLSARRSATVLRSAPGLIAYKKSALRNTPCVVFPEERSFIAPLPDLVALRVSHGTYYDIVGDGTINRIMGKRFENYVELLLHNYLPEIECAREERYSIRRGFEYDTPDLRLSHDGRLISVIECKANRASHGAKFSDDPAEAAGLEYLAAGVFQIWRYNSHHRRGFIGDGRNGPASGILLTLDTWADMSHPMRSELFRLAKDLAAKKEPAITDEDMIPVGLLHIDDLEGLLSTATPTSLMKAIDLWLNDEQYEGWSLRTVHDKVEGHRAPQDGQIYDRLPRPAAMSWWPTADRLSKRQLGS